MSSNLLVLSCYYSIILLYRNESLNFGGQHATEPLHTMFTQKPFLSKRVFSYFTAFQLHSNANE